MSQTKGKPANSEEGLLAGDECEVYGSLYVLLTRTDGSTLL